MAAQKNNKYMSSFESFLRDSGWYEQFCYNFITHWNGLCQDPDKKLREFFNKDPGSRAIISAFVAETTPEGNDFWYEAHLKWEEWLSK